MISSRELEWKTLFWKKIVSARIPDSFSTVKSSSGCYFPAPNPSTLSSPGSPHPPVLMTKAKMMTPSVLGISPKMRRLFVSFGPFDGNEIFAKIMSNGQNHLQKNFTATARGVGFRCQFDRHIDFLSGLWKTALHGNQTLKAVFPAKNRQKMVQHIN